MTRREIVKRAIAFERPERVPIYYFNRDQLDGDILLYGLWLDAEGANEWGYRWETLDDGTMGQPKEPVLPTWDALDGYRFPELECARRLGNPYMIVNLDVGEARAQAAAFLREPHRQLALNIAGPRESEAPGIYTKARTFLLAVFRCRRISD